MHMPEHLASALRGAEAVAYEWGVDTDTLLWKGDVGGLLRLPGSADLSSRRKFEAYVHPDDREQEQRFCASVREHEGIFTGEYRMLVDGKVIPVEDMAAMQHNGGDRHVVGVLRRMITEKQPSMPPSYPYCAEFVAMLEVSLRRCAEANKTGVLLQFSLDNFASFIMMFGREHAERVVGDLLMQLQALLGKKALVQRLSIQQFAVIVLNRPAEEVEKFIDTVHQVIARPGNLSRDESMLLKCASSSVWFAEAADAQDAMAKAFLALEEARDRLTSSHCDYSEAQSSHSIAADKLRKMKDLQEAISEKRLLLAYQPVVESRTGQVYGYECLLRVRDKEGGALYSAGPVIPLAEKMGLIDVIDQRVLEMVVEDLTRHRDVRLGINISSLSTDNPMWLRLCTRLLKDGQVASRLMIEITETAAQKDLRQTAYFVAALQSMGCQVALDDFGAGYTSFRQLKSLSVDMVKIDGAYVHDLANSSENQLFIRTLLEFNGSYGLKTIAECVESGEVAKILMDLGVDYMQGHYFGLVEAAPAWKVKA